MQDDLVGLLKPVQFFFVSFFYDIQRNQRGPFDPADFIFALPAHVDQLEVLAAVEHLLDRFRRNFQILVRGGLLGGGWNTAELFVIDQLGDRGIVPADGAILVLAQFHLAKFQSQRVEHHQASVQIVALIENQLDRLVGLQSADDAAQHAQHAALGTTRHQTGRRRFGIQTAVAGTRPRIEHRYLPFETQDTTVNIGLLQQNTGIVGKIARREIIRSVDDHVPIRENAHGVLRGQTFVVGDHFHVGIEIGDPVFGRLHFQLADGGFAVGDLPLEVAFIDDVEIDQPQLAHTRGGEVQGDRRPQPAGPNTQDFGIADFFLPFHAHFRQQQMAAVTIDLIRV